MIGIIGAMDVEIESLKNELTDINEVEYYGSTFYTGKIHGVDVVLTRSGIGKVNSALAVSALKLIFNCDAVINTGIAGGTELTSSEDVIIAKRCAYHDFDAQIFGYALGQVPGSPLFYEADAELVSRAEGALSSLSIPYKAGTVLSGDSFVTEKSVYGKMKISDALACEMEGTSIAQAATKLGLPFIIIRYISDIIGSEGQISDYTAYERQMAERSGKICIKILEFLK